MAGVFQNIDPPPPPPLLWCGGGHTRWLERGVGGQYFERRQAQLCTLRMQVLCGTRCLGRVGDVKRECLRIYVQYKD
jgi:hypothetical protein